MVGMTKKEVMYRALGFDDPPYTPWAVGFTVPAAAELEAHYGGPIAERMHNHIVGISWHHHEFEPVGAERYRDRFGVVWDRSVDKDIGVICDPPIPEPTLADYRFPDVDLGELDRQLAEVCAAHPEEFIQFSIGFSLYERAWTLRGMESFLEDVVLREAFAHELLDAICEFNCRLLDVAVRHPIDGVHFGDDWGCQRGLILGYDRWAEFIRPRFARMCKKGRDAGKFVSMHSCGMVQELFGDLVEMGLGCFNPFQPEVMDVFEMKRRWHGKLAFHGGLSTQKLLPYGTPDEVREMTARLLAGVGAGGGYVFAPSHAVPGDVPLANLLAFIEVVQAQPGAPTA